VKEKARKFWKSLGKVMIYSVLPVIFSGILRAIGIYIFVSPNNFAPGGTNGIAVMLEYLTKINSGWWLFAINIPLFFVAFFFLGKREAIVSTASMLFSSLLLILMDIPAINEAISPYQYVPESGGLLAAVAGGIMFGVALVIMLRACGTSGGMTVLATLVNKKYSNLSISGLTAVFDGIVVVASFFVYNQGASFTAKLDPVLLALVSLFFTSKVSDIILQGFKTAYKFEIITNEPDKLADEIMTKLHRGVTKISAEGMYSKEGRSMLVCIIRKRQIAELQRIIKPYPDTFAFFTSVSEVYGRFTK